MEKKKKILVPIFNRAHYGRLRSVLKSIDEHPLLDLQVIVASPLAHDHFFLNLKHSRPYSWPMALKWYIKARFLALLSKLRSKPVIGKDFLMNNLFNDDFKIQGRIPLFLDGGSSISMTKAVGFGIIKLADELQRLNPDIVFVNADRFEMMSIALAAAYSNIIIAHNEGGDVSGTIDESIRHSITKLSHIHLTSTKESRQRVIQMGENPDNVFVVGSPTIDHVKDLDLNSFSKNILNNFDINKPYLLVLFHPVATESIQQNILMTRNILKVLEDLAMPTILLGSNIDACSYEVGEVIRQWLLEKKPEFVFFEKHFHPDDFYRALAKAQCAIGNSSSFIREGSYFGTPVVLVGSRQNGREKSQNIKETGAGSEEIKKAVLEQINHGRYSPSYLFGEGKAGEKIADILAKVNPDIQKRFFKL